MKVKILLPPLLILIIIVMLIWFVYPAYTNGADGFKEQRSKLADEQNKLATIKSKASNIDRLYVQLQTDKVDYNTILSYIPEQPQEENIINSLSLIANNVGVFPKNISVAKNRPVVNITSSAASEAGTADTTDGSVGAMELDAACSVMGDYDQIKSFLNAAYRLERFNRVTSLDIKKVESPEGKDTGNLEADAVLTFDFIKRLSNAADVNNPVFSNISFNMKTAQDIKNRNGVPLPTLNVDQSGRANPFSLN